jgi:photosystem II PsbY protein
VLFNIGGPALNQIDNMKKGALAGTGLATLFVASQADAATEMMTVADGRAGLLAFPLLAALGWVLFNIAGPALNQIDNMKK